MSVTSSEFEVFDSVVSSDTVFVVNAFVVGEMTTQVKGHHIAVLGGFFAFAEEEGCSGEITVFFLKVPFGLKPVSARQTASGLCTKVVQADGFFPSAPTSAKHSSFFPS